MKWEPNLAEDAPLSEVRRSLCVSASAGASAPLTYAPPFPFLLAPLYAPYTLYPLYALCTPLSSLRSSSLYEPASALNLLGTPQNGISISEEALVASHESTLQLALFLSMRGTKALKEYMHIHSTSLCA